MINRLIVLTLSLLAMSAPSSALEVNGQLKNATLEKLSSDPTCSSTYEAKIFWDSDDNLFRLCDGSAWLSVLSLGTGGALSPAIGGTGVANNAAATLTRSGNHALTLTTTNTTSLTLPTTGTLSTVGGAETLTSKTLTTPELDNPLIDGYADFNEESAPSTPSAGVVRLYAKTDKKIYKKDSDGTESEVGSGSGGSGEITVVDAPSDATGWTASNTGITVATSTTSTDLPLAGVVDTAIKITPVSSTDYVYYRWTMPAALKNRKLKVEWHQRPLSGYATGDLKLEVYKNAASNYGGSYTEFSLSTDSSGTTSIPNATGKFTSTFDADDGDYYELRIVRTAGTTALNLAGVIVGPGIQPQGAVVEEWIAYTPTFSAGFGTTSNVFFEYRRVGSEMQIRGRVTSGTTTTGSATFSIPSGYTAGTANYASAHGKYTVNNASAPLMGNCRIATGATAVTLDTDSDSAPNTSSIIESSKIVSIEASVPIAEWSGSGTVNLAQNDVEYASTSGTWDASSSTTVYGQSGSQMGGALTGGRAKTVTWKYPIQVTDKFDVEFSTDRVNWHSANFSRIGGSSTYVIPGIDSGFTAFSGVVWRHPSSTTTEVLFGRYASIANDDSPTGDWPSDAYWRVVKYSGGAAVGFGIASGGNSGLIPYYRSEPVSLTFTFNGSGGNNTQNATVTRIGNVVTLDLPAYQATTGTSSTSFASSALPTWARPPTDRSWLAVRGRDNAAPDSSNTAMLYIASSTGVITLSRNYAATAWTNSASAGFQTGFSVSYAASN